MANIMPTYWTNSMIIWRKNGYIRPRKSSFPSRQCKGAHMFSLQGKTSWIGLQIAPASTLFSRWQIAAQNLSDPSWLDLNIAANVVCTFAIDLHLVNAAPTLHWAFTFLILRADVSHPFFWYALGTSHLTHLYSSIVKNNIVLLFVSFWCGCSFWPSFTRVILDYV